MCERHIDWLPLTHPQLGSWPITPGMCPDGELNWQPFDSQACTQPTRQVVVNLESWTKITSRGNTCARGSEVDTSREHLRI